MGPIERCSPRCVGSVFGPCNGIGCHARHDPGLASPSDSEEVDLPTPDRPSTHRRGDRRADRAAGSAEPELGTPRIHGDRSSSATESAPRQSSGCSPGCGYEPRRPGTRAADRHAIRRNCSPTVTLFGSTCVPALILPRCSSRRPLPPSATRGAPRPWLPAPTRLDTGMAPHGSVPLRRLGRSTARYRCD